MISFFYGTIIKSINMRRDVFFCFFVNGLVNMLLQNIFYISQKKVSYTSLERHEGEEMMIEFNFGVNYPRHQNKMMIQICA